MQPLDFNDTQIAFSSRSTAELHRAKLLFNSFNHPALITVGPKLAQFAMSLHLPVAPLIKATVFKHFCGGVTIDDCAGTVSSLGQYHIRSVLDYSVEGLGREADFDAAFTETLRSIERAKGQATMPFAVFKATGLGRMALLEKASSAKELTSEEQEELKHVRRRMHDLAAAAKRNGLRILIDAEETWIQPVIDEIALDLMREFNREGPVVYNTLQMYRKDRLAYLRDLLRLGKEGGFKPGVKLVRGAYMEKERARAAKLGYPSPIQDTKQATDHDFDAALAFCIEHIDELGLFAGTHNERSSLLLAELMRRRGLKPNDARVEFSQLFGMSDHLTYNLAHHGYNASKYVPYGPVRAVLPYLVRRAEENSSIKGQATRELQLIEKELFRRRQKSHS